MKDILAWIALNQLLSLAIVIGIFLCLIVLLFFINENFKSGLKFWWLNFSMGFPFIGTIAATSKDNNITGNKWYACEETLCGKYYDFEQNDLSLNNLEYYRKCKSYLVSMGEQGRRPLPLFIWIVIVGLVLIEALGFAYVLAGYTIPGASESLQQKGALGIAFLISIVLVGFTHWAGSQMYNNKKIEAMYLEKGNSDFSSVKNTNISIDNEFIDKDETIHAHKVYARIDNDEKRKHYGIICITAFFVIAVAAGATYVRGQVLEKQLIQEVSAVSTNIYDMAPAELGEIQLQADNKALKEQQEADRKGGWGTFIVLAVLFVFIQALGVLFGFKWGFAGKESKVAYQYSHRFRNEREYEHYYTQTKRKIAAKANSSLKAMREQIAKIYRRRQNNYSTEGLAKDYERTYEKYVEREEQNYRNQKTQRLVDEYKDKKQAQKIIAKEQEKAIEENSGNKSELEQVKANRDRFLNTLKTFKDELAGLDEDFGEEAEIKRAKELKEKIQKGESKIQELEEKIKNLKGE
ncbi:MAG: hypothetical protein PUB96_01780 [Helicobacteraceae bacterium]|nr:hypothetical protein [Helicobacteraceae bacterium]